MSRLARRGLNREDRLWFRTAPDVMKIRFSRNWAKVRVAMILDESKRPAPA
jgi:hypothetical protein